MVEIRRLSSADAGFEGALRELLAFEAAQDDAVDVAVAAILEDVHQRGDTALVEITARFDRGAPASPAELEIPLEAAHRALANLPAAEGDALRFAAARIRDHHERQRLQSWRSEEPDGTVLGQQ